MLTGVYLIRNIISKMDYVGSSIDITKRFSAHKRALNRNSHPNTHLQNAWNKYGEVAFEFVVVAECAVKDLLQYEQEALDFAFESTGKDILYNIAYFAEAPWRGRKHSKETCEKLSMISKGRTVTPETRMKISIAMRGKKHTPEQLEKMSASMKGINCGRVLGSQSIEHVKNRASANRGRKRSKETRKKISAALKGKKFTLEHRNALSMAHKK